LAVPIYRKLVRDLIPQVITASGKTCLVEVLDQGAYLVELNRKLAEELAEYQASQDIAELADLVEVALALVKAKGHTLPEFEALRQAKVLDRGAFDQRLFLVQVDDA
jgi:predicted house-cleaning noncanonical NTP pyrophosphatase (MazG superfamily)